MLAGCFKFLETERFQQVVHGIDPEPFHGILRIGRREDNGGRMRQRLDEIHPAEIRHVDVQEERIGLRDIGRRHRGAAAGSHQLQERDLGHVHFQLAQGQRLIVYGYDPDHDARRVWSGTASKTS